jgi:L-aminopeptidase/D-esterase-like protein
MMRGITAVPGLRVGHGTDLDARTGCTVILGPFRAAVDIRGMATGSRELETLSALHVTQFANALLLTGGSAFGLEAAQGVMSWLEERGAGYDTGVARVPIVPAAVIFDLAVGRADRRPDAAMGRAACEAASDGPVAEGIIGVGTGATVGKLRGPEGAMPGGVGSWAVAGPGCTVGALVVVNAVGDVVARDGQILAGARDEAGNFLDAERAIRDGILLEGLAGLSELAGGGSVGAGAPRDGGETVAPARGPFSGPLPGTNTTLAVVATDAPLTKNALEAMARIAATGVARRITPVHTPFDGDLTFALSTAAESRELSPGFVLTLGVLAAHALEVAIERAVTRDGGQPSRN